MHYHEHLGKQAISFLRNLMKQYSNDKFEEQFFEMLKSYPSLNGLLLSDMKEGMLSNEEVIKILEQFRDRQGNSKDDVEAFNVAIKSLSQYKVGYVDALEIIKDRIIYKMRKLEPSDFKEITLYNDLLKDVETIKKK